MSDVMSDVEEVRHGLFRICWKHTKRILGISNINCKEIKLCGSQLGRSIVISLQVSPSQYVVTAVTVCTEPKVVSMAGKELIEKRQKLDDESSKSEKNMEHWVEPQKVWIEIAGDKVNPITTLEICRNNSSWEEKKQEWSIIVWIDFGEARKIHVNKGLAEMLHSQTHCDVQFQFKNGQSIGAHIVILSASSPVFAAMFKPEFKESQTRVVVIEDIDVQVFRHLLDYFYTSEAPRITRNEESSIMLLYEAADKYDVNDLKKECVEMLLMQLDTENAIELLIWSEFHVIPELLEAARKKIVKNYKMLCSQPSWLNLMKNHLMKNHRKLFLKVTEEMADLVENSEH
jgi:speckle-type POZ protein